MGDAFIILGVASDGARVVIDAAGDLLRQQALMFEQNDSPFVR